MDPSKGRVLVLEDAGMVVPGVSGLVNVISLASRESTLAVAGVDFLTMTDGQCV